jgi:hypothetical protein
MITDPDDTMRGVLEFLGVRYDPAPTQFLRTNRINSSFVASGSSVQAPPALTEPWSEWRPAQRYVFFEEAGPTMVACGLATEAELIEWGLSTDDGKANGRPDEHTGTPLSGLEQG